MTVQRRVTRRLMQVAAALLLAASQSADAGDATTDAVVLKSGKVLQGKVVGETKVGDAKMLTVATDFGQILVPAAEVKERKTAAPETADAPFAFREIRVVEIAGSVQRHAQGETAWQPLFDQYRKAEDGPYADILPGDSVRTGADGVVAFIPSKDVWIRLTPNTEIEIPLRGAGASLELKGGDVQVGSAAGPDGKEVRVRTGSSTVGVRGGHVAVQSKDGKDAVAVGEGEARVEGGPKVGAGSAADLPKDGPPVVRKATDDEKRRTSDRFVPRPADDYVYVPGGTYQLGGKPSTELSLRHCNEQAFSARIDGYLIGRTQVSLADYVRFAGANDAPLPDYAGPAAVPDDLRRRPVIRISWFDARRYAQWCVADLPTAVQWEVAARGPRSSVAPWGDGPAPPRLPQGAAGKKDDMLKCLRTLPALDEPTLDKSPFGVLGLVSFAYDFCREWIEDTKYVNIYGNTGVYEARTWRLARGWATRCLVAVKPDDREQPAGIRLVREVK